MYDNFLRFVNIINYVIYTRLSKEEQAKSCGDQGRNIIMVYCRRRKNLSQFSI